MKNKINTTLSNSFKIWSNRRNRDKIDFIYKYSHCSFIIKKNSCIFWTSKMVKWHREMSLCTICIFERHFIFIFNKLKWQNNTLSEKFQIESNNWRKRGKMDTSDTHVHHRSFSYLGPEIIKNDDVQDCCHICSVTIYVVLSCSVVDV